MTIIEENLSNGIKTEEEDLAKENSRLTELCFQLMAEKQNVNTDQGKEIAELTDLNFDLMSEKIDLETRLNDALGENAKLKESVNVLKNQLARLSKPDPSYASLFYEMANIKKENDRMKIEAKERNKSNPMDRQKVETGEKELPKAEPEVNSLKQKIRSLKSVSTSKLPEMTSPRKEGGAAPTGTTATPPGVTDTPGVKTRSQLKTEAGPAKPVAAVQESDTKPTGKTFFSKLGGPKKKPVTIPAPFSFTTREEKKNQAKTRRDSKKWFKFPPMFFFLHN